MRMKTWIAIVVLAHFVITLVHGAAHTKAQVPLSPAANVFVFVVIVAGPLIGLGLTWLAERVGLWVVALTMAGAFIFGFVNHFVLISPDHVAHVDPQSRPLFLTTAILLALTEVTGLGLAVCALRRRRI